jgi:uncharacterized protein DUF6815
VFRGAPDTPVSQARNYSRLVPIFDALTSAGIEVVVVLFSEAIAWDMPQRLSRFDGVLVWVDPISADGDRTVLDTVLREVAFRETWVSAHPDTILKMGTKEVLSRTRELGWGADTRSYSSVAEFEELFPLRLARDRVRVLKQNRGNGGIGVWKVEALDADARRVRVQHAAPRDDATEDLTLAEFMKRCAAYFHGAGMLVDQPFATRLSEGIIRAYLVEQEVVGFARQRPVSQLVDANAPEPDRVLGMPSAKTMYAAAEPEFAELRSRLEREWVPSLCRLVDVSDAAIPVLWDADFLYGPRTDRGADTYMLCEINVSSVIPFPDAVPTKVATAVKRRIVGHL